MADDKEIRIDVTANDKASAVITDAAKNAEAAMKRLGSEQKRLDAATKEGFRNTKSSAEFFGTIANFAGGGQISTIAMQIGGLTEKTAQFNEVAKQGGIAADALKVGLAAAAGAIGFQIGKQIGNVVFEVERWNAELETAVKQLDKLEGKRLTALAKSFSEFKINLEFDDDAESTAREKIERLGNDISSLEMNSQSARKAIAEMHQQGVQGNIFSVDDPTLSGADKLAAYLETFTGEFKASLAEKEKLLLADEATLDLYRKQKEELEDMLGKDKERAKARQEQAETKQSGSFIESLQGQLTSLQSDLEGTTNITEAIKNTIAADRDAAIGLLDEIESTKQAIKDKQAEEQSAKRLSDFKQSELDKLQEEIILLEKGKQAARAFRLEKQGLSKEDAAELASAESKLAALKEKPQKTSELQAMESRLMVGGRGGNDVQDQIEKNTKEVANAAKEQRIILNETKAILKQIADKNTVSLEVVA